MSFDEWMTPPSEIELARTFLDTITLDPASNRIAQEYVRAEMFGSLDPNDQYIANCIGDGLTKPWYGNVWLNPPYSSGNINTFVRKVIHEVPSVDRMLVLVNSATDTAWFHSLLNNAQAVLFYRRRVKFWKMFDGKAHDLWVSSTNGKIVNNPRYLNTLFMFACEDLQSHFYNVYNERGTIIYPT
jgi:hypothetical protein